METDKEIVSNNDNTDPTFVKFLQDLHRYAERSPHGDNSDLKKHIASFPTIYNQCDKKDELSVFISKASGLITRLYSKLSEYIYENERHYIQKFYLHWKHILGHMKRKSRSKCCTSNLPQMITSLRHLRSALNRMEQMSILDVLCLYVENAKLQGIKSDQMPINSLLEIACMAKMKSQKAAHTFLNYINVDEDNIFSIKPTNAQAVNFQFDPFEQNQEVWFDFNLKEASIAFVAYSSATDDLLCSGIAPATEIQEYSLNGEYLLITSGWNLSHTNGIQKPDSAPRIVFTCRVTDKIKVNSLKSRFNISEYLDYGAAATEEALEDIFAGKVHSKRLI